MKTPDNRLIKDHLTNHINNAVQYFRDHPYPKLLRQELNQVDQYEWIADPEIDINAVKKEHISSIESLLHDTTLHAQIDDLIGSLPDPAQVDLREHTGHQLITNLTQIGSTIPDDRKGYRLNLLFLEHDFFPEASFCGFDDEDYEFALLNGTEYLEYNWRNELFNGAGKFDYALLLNPFLEFESELGEDRVDEINDSLSLGSYLDEIRRLFYLNAYTNIHLGLEGIQTLIGSIGIPMREKAYVFANEHDCPQLNIFVLG